MKSNTYTESLVVAVALLVIAYRFTTWFARQAVSLAWHVSKEGRALANEFKV